MVTWLCSLFAFSPGENKQVRNAFEALAKDVPEKEQRTPRVVHAKPDDQKIRIPRGWQRQVDDWKRRHRA
jgi:hypothetical protein